VAIYVLLTVKRWSHNLQREASFETKP